MFSKDKIKMEKMLRIQCCCLLCRLPTFGLGGPVTQRDEVVMYKVVEDPVGERRKKEDDWLNKHLLNPVEFIGFWQRKRAFHFEGKWNPKFPDYWHQIIYWSVFYCGGVVGGVSSVTSAIVRHYSIKCAVTAVENKGNARNGFECVHPTSFKY